MALFGKASQKPRALVAAAAKVDINDRNAVAGIRKRKEAWQDEAWEMYDDVGEVKYGIDFLANSCARLRLFVAEKPEDPTDRPTVTENAAAKDVLDRLRSPMGGHAHILRPLAVNLGVPGECNLIGISKRTDSTGKVLQEESWDIYSTDELSEKDGKVVVTDENGKEIGLDDDFVLRIWMKHARKRSKADSSLHGVLSPCREIVLVEKAIQAIAQSRIANAGILFLSDQFSFGSDDDSKQDEAGSDADQFSKDLTEAMVTPIRNPGDASAVVPVVVTGSNEAIAATKHLTFERPFDPELDKRMERAQRRLAQGLNVPPEVILGLADVNHWTAWQIDDSTFKAHVEPLAVVICDALTVGYLHPMMEEASVADFEKYLIWYDPSDLVINPNREQSANDGHDRLTISDDAWRKTHGFTDDDAPKEEEIARRIAQKAAGRPSLPEGTTERQVVPGPPDAEEENAVTAATTPKRGQALGQKLTGIDRTLRSLILGATDAAMQRALERAGAKLRGKAQSDRATSDAIKGVTASLVPATLGPSVVAALGMDEQELLDGAFENVKPKFYAWVERAQDEARGLVPAMSKAEHELVKARQLSDLDDAWLWLSDSLASLARQRLYDPSPSAPQVGEFLSSVSVPFGIVREAVTRAGGADGIEKSVGVVLSDAGSVPVDGIGNGQVVRNLMQQKGGSIEAWEWSYGEFPREHPFEPHSDLDGVVFQSWTDDELVNTEGWPDGGYFQPGDHDGCSCDFFATWVFSTAQAEVAA